MSESNFVMDSDDEGDDLHEQHKEERTQKLGFRPQNEIYCNKFLPYSDILDSESLLMLESIKNDLAKAVAMREIVPSVGLSLNRLMAYIKLYGMKFSKKDHIAFIKLLLELIKIPTIDPVRLNRYLMILSQLLRKSSWLSPDELQIEWRPLYNLSKIYISKNSTKGDFYRFFSPRKNEMKHGGQSPNGIDVAALLARLGPDIGQWLQNVDGDQKTLENNLQLVAQQCATYFTKESTREILDEIFPKLYPLDTGKSCDTFSFLALFLNYTHDFDLWFYDCMDMWSTYHNPSWHGDLMNKIAGLASENIGLIDWEPYIPIIFTRILRSLELPVCYKNTKSSRNQSLYASSVAIWITSTLGPNSSCQSQLKQFLRAIESYIHPANSGKWLHKITDILVQLPKFFTERLIRERYKKHPWKRQTPDSYKLTEDCITSFVESFKPIAFQAVYSRMNSGDVGRIFKHLTDLRPELIIPNVIERVFQTLDSLTEPNKMTASLLCLVSVSRALVSGHKGYTTGKTHVIPILYATLPGIDSNDFRKTSITFEFLTSFALLVPIVDCSKAGLYWDDLTEEEMLICDQTAEFEGFVLQYLDKVFTLIEASSQESIRMEQSDIDNLRSRLESVAEASLQSSTHGILGQCSEEIVASATRKVVDFIKSHQFEPRVAAHLVASLVRVFSRVAGPDMRKLFVPYIIERINDYINDHEDAASVDKQSDEFLYYIILLTSVVRGNPADIILIVDDIIPIIDRISKFKCKTTNKYSNAILINILSNVSILQTLDVHSSPESFVKPLKEFLPIRHWGTKSNTPISWYVPDEKAKLVCEMIIHRYLPPLIEQFDKYVAGEVEMTREEILRDTSTVLALLKCPNMLPNWDSEEKIAIGESSIDTKYFPLKLGFEHLTITMPNGENVRLVVTKCIAKLQDKVLVAYEDDIKTQKAIILIWERVHIRKQFTTPFDMQHKSFKLLKFFQEYSLTKKRRDIRAIIATRVLMQQDCRDEYARPDFTPSHMTVIMKLFQLSVSHYSNVRSLAQAKLFNMLAMYRQSHNAILNEVERYLAKNSNEEHEAFKAILYIIGGSRRGRMIVHNNWQIIERLWVALLKTNLSEKPSVVKLMDSLVETIQTEFPTVFIGMDIPDECVKKALEIAANPNVVSDDDIEAGKKRLFERNEKNLQSYNNLLKSILQITHNNSLHWRYGLMASGMIFNLVHPEVKFPLEVVQYCVHNLINESIEERKLAIRTMRYILRQQKPMHVKLDCDPYAVAQITKPDRPIFRPGVRADNRWLQYSLDSLPQNQQDWDEPRYVHKTEGFFGWSSSFAVYAPSEKQPNINQTRDELNECQQVVWDFFSNAANIEKLLHFWSLEEKRGHEKFNRSRCFVVKGLCDMFGPMIVDQLVPHIDRLIRSTKNLESNHRCAAELMSGIMRGLKHWPYKETEAVYERLKPLIQLALSSTTVETDVFWGTCFATAAENIDPKRQYWLHEILLDDPLRQSSSFIDCVRIYCLQGPYNQHVWRMTSVSHRLLNYLRPFLNHPFQNVRERLGSILINIFEVDLVFKESNSPECPRIKDFIGEVMEKIVILNEDYPEAIASTGEGPSTLESLAKINPEYDEAVRLFKTVCQWLTGVLNRNTNGNIAEYFEFLPIACRLERCEQDTELATTCSSLLALISQALTLPECMPVALQKIEDVSRMPSWSARLSVIDVLQVLVFNNMPIVLSRDEWVQKVQDIVLRLLEDSILEVRVKAAQVLGGLLHCSFLPATNKLLDLFKRKCRTKLVKNGTRNNLPAGGKNDVKAVAAECGSIVAQLETQEVESVRRRHMGVLGLCAFISAYPYDIPDFVPDVFEHLEAHLNDPQPIPSTIRKTVGDFKRTHHDNWSTHQLKFTENQLALLSDLTIPPSYYA